MSAIGGIQNNVAMSAAYSRSATGLTTDQKNGIQSVLKNFDAENLTANDAKQITSEFKKLGVQPGKDLETAMAASGFDARQVGQLAFGSAMPPGGPQTGNQPPPPSMVDKNSPKIDVGEYLTSLIASLTTNSEDSSKDGMTKNELSQILQNASDLLGSTGNLVDRSV